MRAAKHLPARRDRPGMLVRAVLALLFLGATGACEFVYLPECDTDCQAGGGNDSYGGNTP